MLDKCPSALGGCKTPSKLTTAIPRNRNEDEIVKMKYLRCFFVTCSIAVKEKNSIITCTLVRFGEKNEK